MKNLVKILVFVCVCLSASFGYAQITVNINPSPPPEPVMEQPVEEVGPPPVEAVPRDMIVVPSEGQPVYLVPGRVGVYFAGGFWYRYWGNAWYRTADYGRPWVVIPAPPAYIAAVPPDYVLSVPPTYNRIHYNDFHNHWRGWDRDRHWDHQTFYRDHGRQRWDHHNRPGYDRFNDWNRNKGWGHDKSFRDRNRDRDRDRNKKIDRDRDGIRKGDRSGDKKGGGGVRKDPVRDGGGSSGRDVGEKR
jgi:hypothetical protein